MNDGFTALLSNRLHGTLRFSQVSTGLRPTKLAGNLLTTSNASEKTLIDECGMSNTIQGPAET